MLEVRDLQVSIQETAILHGVNLVIPPGAVAGLVGRNGAGKTTLMRSIMGLIAGIRGAIALDGQDLAKASPHRRAHLGIGYMPEDRRLVPELTVEENVLVPAWATGSADIAQRLRWIYQAIPEVKSFAARKAMQLSGGQQKLVALARALMTGRRLLLLDEPFEGVAPALAHRLVEVIAGLRADNLAVLLSESDYTHSAALVNQLFVIERGSVRQA